MKKILGIVVLCACATAFATSVSAPTNYGPLTWEAVFGWNVATATPVIPNGAQGLSNHTASKNDTLVGIDSIALLNHYPIQPGYAYAIQVLDTTGAADSIQFRLKIYGSDGTTLLSNTMVDSIGGATTFKCISLPVGQTIFGSAISIKAMKWIAGKTAKIWRFELIRAKLNANKLF
jgi:hypothetical protein